MNAYELIKTAAEMAEVAKAQGYPAPTSLGTSHFYDDNGGHDGIHVHTEHKAEDFFAWTAFLDADQLDYPEDREGDADGNTYAFGTFAGVRVQVFTGALPKVQVSA